MRGVPPLHQPNIHSYPLPRKSVTETQFLRLSEGMKHGQGMEDAKKDGKRSLFAYIVVISRFIKNPDSYSPIHSEKTPRCFYFLGEKSINNQQ